MELVASMVGLIRFSAMHAWPKFENAVFNMAIKTIHDVCRVIGELPEVRKEPPAKLGLPGDYHSRISSMLDKTLEKIGCNALSDRLKKQMPAYELQSELERLNSDLISWRRQWSSGVEKYLEKGEARLIKMG